MKLSRLGFLTGFFLAIGIFWLCSVLFPPPGIGIGTKSHDEDTLVLPTAYRQDVPTQGQFSRVLEGEAVSVEEEESLGRVEQMEKKGKVAAQAIRPRGPRDGYDIGRVVYLS